MRELSFYKSYETCHGEKVGKPRFRKSSFTNKSKSKTASDTLEALYPQARFLSINIWSNRDSIEMNTAITLHYVLGLQEELRLKPDPSSHGNFLHRIF